MHGAWARAVTWDEGQTARDSVHHVGVTVRKSHTTTVISGGEGRVFVPVPFDPDEVWGAKSRHAIAGTVAGLRVRGSIQSGAAGHGFLLGPAWLRGCGVAPGDLVTVAIEPEGPQRADLADDIAAALEADPKAGAFFDALAQFYRKAYLRWIDATTRRPEQRPIRINEMVELLREEKKART